MATQPSFDRVWDIIERVGVCMLTTRSAAGLRARPLEARPDRDNGVIWFVTDLRSAKEHEIARDGAVGLVFIDTRDKAYLSVTAKAEVRRDHAKAAEIWKRTDNAWWHGPDDKNVWCSASRRLQRSCGTARQARRWRFSNLPRRGSPGPSPSSARTAK